MAGIPALDGGGVAAIGSGPSKLIGSGFMQAIGGDDSDGEPPAIDGGQLGEEMSLNNLGMGQQQGGQFSRPMDAIFGGSQNNPMNIPMPQMMGVANQQQANQQPYISPLNSIMRYGVKQGWF